jgi:mannose/fructose/N-acetylgalactosamine-specific phosphotransferase system component IIC
VRELVRELDDDGRAARAFLALGAAGMMTWFATFTVARALLPAVTLASILGIVFGLVGWRASKQGAPREASTFVAVVLALAFAVCWIFLVFAALARLVSA